MDLWNDFPNSSLTLPISLMEMNYSTRYVSMNAFVMLMLVTPCASCTLTVPVIKNYPYIAVDDMTPYFDA